MKKNGKYCNGKKSLNMKPLALLLALTLLLGCGIGGTLAWLLATDTPVTNTFTTSDIEITLTESDNLDLQMVPGHVITKDPKVTLTAKSEPCYLFVKIGEDLGSWADNMVEENNQPRTAKYSDYLQYQVITTGDNKWTAVPGTTNVYYIAVTEAPANNTEYPILVGNKVTVAEIVTKEMMAEVDGKDAAGNAVTGEKQPTLTFTAYAVQYYKTNNTPFDPAEAWTLAQTATPSTGG